MRQRPIGQLVDLLRNLGARIEYAAEPGFPPIRVHGTGGLPGGLARFGAAQSSQFLSAVLQVAPRARREVQIELDQPQTSWPYVAMTMRLMDEFGAWCELTRDPDTGEPTQINVPAPVEYTPSSYSVEPDASSATYFLAAAAINQGCKATIAGLGKSSLQGDAGFADVLRRMGASVTIGSDSIVVEGTGSLDPIDIDLADMPDTAQTLAVACLFADGISTLRGLHTLRVKETDRLAALQAELTKFGAKIEIGDQTLKIEPPETIRPPGEILTYDDHRMAMSFAVAGSRVPGVLIADPGCVGKTYPGFFDDFQRFLTSDEG
jgi:3-phosphoshikimate 1-carboxyvinyltransferase